MSYKISSFFFFSISYCIFDLPLLSLNFIGKYLRFKSHKLQLLLLDRREMKEQSSVTILIQVWFIYITSFNIWKISCGCWLESGIRNIKLMGTHHMNPIFGWVSSSSYVPSLWLLYRLPNLLIYWYLLK